MDAPEITAAEEDRLRELLQRAAAGVEIVAPGEPLDAAMTVDGEVHRRPARRRSASWVVGGIAATLVAAVVFGVWLGTGKQPATTVGPVETPTTILPPGRGIWRLPTETAGLEILSADWFSNSSIGEFRLAVDDPEAPTKWVGFLENGGMFDSLSGPADTTGSFGTGESWALKHLSGTRSGSTTAMEVTGPAGWRVSIVSRGVSDSDLIATADDFVRRVPMTDGQGNHQFDVMGSPRRAFDEVALPSGLLRTWTPDSFDASSLTYALGRTGGPQPAVSITLSPTGLTRPVRDAADKVDRRPGSRLPEAHVSVRADLGGAVEYAGPDSTSFMVAAEDGTMVTVTSIGEEGSQGTPTPDDLVRIIKGLKSMGEDALRAELDRIGVPLGSDPNSEVMTPTTVLGPPPGPTTAAGEGSSSGP